MLANADIGMVTISCVVTGSCIDFSMQPTGTECNWGKTTLNLSGTIRKAISDKITQIRGNDLKAKSARGVMVLTAGTAAERGLRLVRNMILARVLAPGEIGIMAIVVSLSIAFEAFTNVGIKQSIIQNKRGAEHDYLNVVWWMRAIRGLGLFIIAILAAGYISSFYDKPELLNLLRVAFIAILFRGLISPRAYVLEKEFKFGRAVLLMQGSAALGTIIAIGLALAIRNVWALVAGFVAEAVILCLLSYVLVPFLPRFRIDRECLGELMKFARGMFGLPILTMISMQADIFVLSKLMPAEQVGMYALAISLAQQPSWMFGQVIGRVLLPAFAERQDNKEILRRHVLKIIRATFVFGLPLIALAVIWAKPILSLIYGQKYAAVAIPFGILCVAMLFRVQGSILASVYLAVGKPHLHRRFVTLLAIFVVCLIYPGIKLFGLTGAAGVLLLSNIVAVCTQVAWMRSVIGLTFKNYAFCWLPFS